MFLHRLRFRTTIPTTIQNLCYRGHSKRIPILSSASLISCANNSSNRRQLSNKSSTQDDRKAALIIGSSGSLGSTIASHLKSHHNCIVIGSDIHPPSIDRVDCIDAFIQLPNENISIDNLIDGLKNGIRKLTDDEDDADNGKFEFDAIICASGGFAMDDSLSKNDEISTNASSVGTVYENMMQMNYYPVVAAGEIAKAYMTSSNDGLFVVFGAVAALTPSPGMVAYTSSKVAAHYYVQTLGAMTGKALTKEYKIQRNHELGMKMRRSGRYLDSLSALAILPIMLDTESNRVALPNDDYSNWTKTIDVAKEIGSWIEMPEIRPHSGSLVKVTTKNGENKFTLAR